MSEVWKHIPPRDVFGPDWKGWRPVKYFEWREIQKLKEKK